MGYLGWVRKAASPLGPMNNQGCFTKPAWRAIGGFSLMALTLVEINH